MRSLRKTKLARHVARMPWIAPLLLAAQPALSQVAATLPTVTVSASETPLLQRPASTGSKLDLTPLQTPASVEIIDREQLDLHGDTTIVNAVSRATGITSIGHPGNSGSDLSARGFTGGTAIMQLYDGTRQYGGVSVSFPFDTWSVDHIEVLRGPEAVISGDGAIGGVINVVPKKPTRGAIRQEVQVTGGTQGKAALAYGSGGSINDMLSFRFDVSSDRSSGWVDRGDSSIQAISGALQLDVNPDLRVKLSMAQAKQNPMSYFGTPLINGQQVYELRTKNYGVADSIIEYKDRWTELALDWTPNQQTTVRSKLYQIKSERYWHNSEHYTYNSNTGLIDRTDNTEILHNQDQIGHTSDVAHSHTLLGKPNRVVVGYDINQAIFQHTNNTYTGSSTSVDPYNPDPGYYNSSAAFIPRRRNTADQVAVFTEDRLELTPQWSVVGGLRMDQSHVVRKNLVSGAEDFSANYYFLGHRLGTVYMIQPDTSVYAQYSRAATPVSSQLFMSTSNSKYDMSTGRQVEIGVKQSLADKKGDWSLAVYEIRKNNLVTTDPNNTGQQLQVGQQSSRGVEGTVSLPVAPTVQLDANAALLRAQYDEFNESGTSRNGNTPMDVPTRTANVWLSWKAQPGWTVAGGVRYVGERYGDTANTVQLPSYTVTDMSVQWRMKPQTTVTLRGYNIFDTYYFSTVYYYDNQWFVGPSRRFEVSLNHKF
jgi:iron complex outermembrane receptor protein